MRTVEWNGTGRTFIRVENEASRVSSFCVGPLSRLNSEMVVSRADVRAVRRTPPPPMTAVKPIENTCTCQLRSLHHERLHTRAAVTR